MEMENNSRFLNNSFLHDDYHLDEVGNVVIAIYLIVIGVFDIGGNGISLVFLHKISEIKTSACVMLWSNLCVCNILLFLIGYLPIVLSSCADQYLFGDWGCAAHGFASFTLLCSALNSLVVLSVNRYIAMCRPSLERKWTKRVTIYTILGLWVYTLTWTSPPLFGWSRYTYQPFGTSCGIDWNSTSTADIVYKSTVLLTTYTLQVFTIVTCFIFCQKKISSVNTSVLNKDDISIESAREIQRMKKQAKAHKTHILLALFHIILWLPNVLVSLWVSFSGNSTLPLWAITISAMIGKMSCILNPALHFYSNPKQRTMLKHVFGGRLAKVEPVSRRMSVVLARFDVQKTADGVYVGQNTLNVTSNSATVLTTPAPRISLEHGSSVIL